ncbi:alpha/beta hydrolase [Algibacter sp. PT7-4]|uniref:alpha/beta hydrolase n=1 Tax=Algibacter ulvanivorans TaxID=3400999 RepID=UPI003AB0FA51
MYLEHKGINIYYTETGLGKAIVLLHGFLENANMWTPFIPILSKKNKVITIDLLGHGKTGCLGYIHSMELMANAVSAVLNHLNINKYIIIGHSMGGYVALALAEKQPKAILGLCLMNSTANADSPEKIENRNRAILAVKQNHNTFIRLAINNLFSPKNRILFSKQIKTLIKEAQQTPLQGIIAALEGMKIRKSRLEIFHNTSYKNMLMVSKKDPVLNANLLISQTKNTTIQVVEFPDGHMSHIENEVLFLQNITHFVENL